MERSRSLPWTRLACYAFSGLTAAALLVMVLLFLVQSLPVWSSQGLGFLTNTRWFFRQGEFGAAAMIYGSLAVTGIAIALAAPLGIGTAVFASEVLPRGMRWTFKAGLELLAGIPSVVYGLLGILVLRGHVYGGLAALDLDPTSGDTLLTAGLLLAVMILPTVTSLADDALRAVPASMTRTARSLGLGRGQTVLAVSLPHARRGLVAAVLLAVGRGLGETIAVFLVVGRQDNQWPDPFWSPRPLVEAGQTMTSKLGGPEVHLAWSDPLHWGALVGLGLLLLVTVTLLTLAGVLLGRRGLG